MSVTIEQFEWDAHNAGHLAQAHPEYELEFLEEIPDDFDFELPHLAEAEAVQAWLDSLPREEAEVDERLKKRVTVTMNLHQLMVDGFDHLAKRMGLNSGKDLMYIVLSQYLNRNLPDDFSHDGGIGWQQRK